MPVGLPVLLLLLVAADSTASRTDAPAGNTLAAPALTASETAADIDFARDVQPLLARHCLRCHSDERKMGGLSLASRERAVAGGESGQNPLEPGDRNELLRRLHADNLDERMPLEGPALSAAEIDLLAGWIAAGAPWPAAQPLPPRNVLEEEPKSLLGYVGAWIEMWDKWQLERLRPAGYALVAVLLVMLVLERLKLRYAAAGGEPRGFAARLARVPRLAYAVVVLGLCLYGLAVYLYGLAGDLKSTQQTLAGTQSELQTLQRQGAMANAYGQNEIYWPQHPPRLGGTYYRGNDERNVALFNGGVYRTVTFTLELRDSGDRILQAGDLVTGPPTVRLELRKAPFATSALFSQSALKSVCFSFIPPRPEPAATKGDDAPVAEPGSTSTNPATDKQPMVEPAEPGPTTGGPFLLQVVESDECWDCRAPLPALPADKPLAGMLYLYPNLKERADDHMQDPHYAISYRLKLDEAGRLTPDSTLHLGSMYNVPGVLKTPTGRIAPSEWFDYRPLPEIEGGNSSDPKLLGIEEPGSGRGS